MIEITIICPELAEVKRAVALLCADRPFHELRVRKIADEYIGTVKFVEKLEDETET